MEQNSFRIRLLRAVSEAMRPAWRTAVWVIKMVVPITLAISILEHLGVIGRISEWIAPLFGLVGLPGDSGLVFLTAALSNNYACGGRHRHASASITERSHLAVHGHWSATA